MAELNVYFFNLIHGLSGLYWPLDWTGIFFAKYLGYLIVLITIGFCFRYKSAKQRLTFLTFLVLALTISGIMLTTFRYFYESPRPFISLGFEPLINHENSSSFPSAHTIFYFTLAGVIYFFDKKTAYWLLGASFMIGLGRIFVGVHWPLDVLGGAVFGFLSAYLTFLLLKNGAQEEIVAPQAESASGQNTV